MMQVPTHRLYESSQHRDRFRCVRDDNRLVIETTVMDAGGRVTQQQLTASQCKVDRFADINDDMDFVIASSDSDAATPVVALATTNPIQI